MFGSDGTFVLRHSLLESEHEEILKVTKLAIEHNLASELPVMIENTKATFEGIRNEYRKRGILV